MMDMGVIFLVVFYAKDCLALSEKYGVKYQFGSSPGVGCQDGTFTIKMLLHTRHNHDLPTYVTFVDLVKAFDTVDHTLMLHILKKYSAPPKLRSSIAIMHQDLKVVIKIGKSKETMSQTVGVRQGDCMAPVLFLFMVMAFSVTLEKECTRSGLNMITLQQRSHSPQDIGKMTGHKVQPFSQGNLLTLFFVLYVDNGAFPFKDLLQLELGISLIHNNFVKFGLEIYIGRGNKASKTGCILFHHQVFSLKENSIIRDQWREYGNHKKIQTSQGGVAREKMQTRRKFIHCTYRNKTDNCGKRQCHILSSLQVPAKNR